MPQANICCRQAFTVLFDSTRLATRAAAPCRAAHRRAVRQVAAARARQRVHVCRSDVTFL